MTDFDPILSQAGEGHRQRILALARRAARGRRRRRMARNGAVAFAVILGTLMLYRIGNFRGTPSIPRTNAIHNSEPLQSQPIQSPSNVTIEYFHTDPTILARLSTKPMAGQLQVIDDDALLQSLADAGHPAGLIRANGRTFLLSR